METYAVLIISLTVLHVWLHGHLPFILDHLIAHFLAPLIARFVSTLQRAHVLSENSRLVFPSGPVDSDPISRDLRAVIQLVHRGGIVSGLRIDRKNDILWIGEIRLPARTSRVHPLQRRAS